MLTYVIPLCLGLLGLALLLNLLRLMKGPEMPDRVLALDTLYINGLALTLVIVATMAVLGIWYASLAAREALATEVKSLRETTRGLANTTFLGRPIFGGTTGNTQAFVVDTTSGATPQPIVYQGDGGEDGGEGRRRGRGNRGASRQARIPPNPDRRSGAG